MVLLILKINHHSKTMNKLKISLVLVFSVLLSMYIAYQELVSSFDFWEWIRIFFGILSGPLYVVWALIYEKYVSLVNLIFAFFVILISIFPIWFSNKRKSILIFFFGALFWVCMGYFMSVAIYI